MSFLSSLPDSATLLHVFKAFPETSRPLLEFHEVLLRGPSPLTAAERELIAAYVSALNSCRYCRAVHTATAERLGAPTGLVAQLLGGLDHAPIEPRLRPLLRYARKLTEDPGGLTRADAEAVFEQGWSDATLYHLVAVTALFNFMNRLVEGLGIELTAGYADQAAERLTNQGYRPLIEIVARAGG
jgi:uncharacterized peroxidase-related enzyme